MTRWHYPPWVWPEENENHTPWFLATCHDCQPVLPQPFRDQTERDQWAQAHATATGHHITTSQETTT